MNDTDIINAPLEEASSPDISDTIHSPQGQSLEPNHRKVAKLPKPLRDRINTMFDDGCSAREILSRLQASTEPQLPYPISELNIHRWRNTGYRRYLALQDHLALLQSNREGVDGLTEGEPTVLPEATLQIIANQFYELLAGFSPETLREKLSEDPLQYTRFLNVFARLSREIVHLRKFRDASKTAAAAQLKQRDPDRDLSDSELNLLVNRMDRVFKVARPHNAALHSPSAQKEPPPAHP